MNNSNAGTGITAAGFGIYSIGWNVIVASTPGINSFGALMKAQLRSPVAFLLTWSGMFSNNGIEFNQLVYDRAAGSIFGVRGTIAVNSYNGAQQA